MKNVLIILLAVAVVLVAIAFIFGVPYIAYLLVLKAGAPKYVAVITAIAVFVFGWFTIPSKRK